MALTINMFYKKRLWHLFISILLIPQLALAKEVIKSAVSPEFPKGLHAKYLTYLANKADMELTLFPIPFARRVVALKKGEIDIMVGIKSTYADSSDLVFLQPAYERLRGAYFVRADETKTLQHESQLRDIIMGISIQDEKIMALARQPFKEVVPVTNLKQKIHLLKKRRVDSFMHFESSALAMIATEGLAQDIVRAPYQNQEYEYYHFAVGRSSPLLLHWEKLETLIAQGVAAGDFLSIRLQHYAEHPEPQEEQFH